MIELGRRQLFDGHPIQKRRACHDVAVRRDLEGIEGKHASEEFPRRRFRPAPEIAVETALVIHPDDARHRHQQHAAGAEDARALGNDRRHIVDELQCLRDDDAVVAVRRDRVRTPEIGDDRRLAVCRIDVEHIVRRDGVSTETLRIRRVPDLEDSTSHVGPVDLEKVFDVVPVDGLPSIPPRVPAQWLQAPEVAPFDPRHAARFEQPNGVRDLQPEPFELGFEREGPRFERPPVVALAQQEGFLALNELQAMSFHRSAMLGVEMFESREVGLGLDRSPVARPCSHAVVQQGLLENDSVETVFDRRSPEIQELEGRQAFVESGDCLPQSAPQHGRCVRNGAGRHRLDECRDGGTPHVCRGPKCAHRTRDEIDAGVRVETRGGRFEIARIEDVVRVQPHEVLGRCEARSAIAGGGSSAAAGLRDPRTLLLQPRQHLSRADLAGPAIDHDDLGGRTGLAFHAGERLEEQAAEIVARDDSRDPSYRHLAPRRRSHQP